VRAHGRRIEVRAEECQPDRRGGENGRNHRSLAICCTIATGNTTVS
jgi:hypothetical protein